MLDIHVPEPVPGKPSTRFKVKIIKAREEVEIETSALPDEVYDEALVLGLIVLANRGQSKITGTTFPDAQERAEESARVAEKTIADLYEGKFRRTSGNKPTGTGARGELMVEARRLAKIYVKAELKEAGLRVSLIKPAEITKLANEMIENDPTIMDEAKENVAKRHEKGRGKKIDIAALKARVKEDPELVEKHVARSKIRKRSDAEEEEELTTPIPPRGGGSERRIGR